MNTPFKSQISNVKSSAVDAVAGNPAEPMHGLSTSAAVPPVKGNKDITFHVTNLSGPDAAFLTGVISFFTDPHYTELAAAVRAGRFALAYGQRTGAAAAIPVALFGTN